VLFRRIRGDPDGGSLFGGRKIPARSTVEWETELSWVPESSALRSRSKHAEVNAGKSNDFALEQ